MTASLNAILELARQSSHSGRVREGLAIYIVAASCQSQNQPKASLNRKRDENKVTRTPSRNLVLQDATDSLKNTSSSSDPQDKVSQVEYQTL